MTDLERFAQLLLEAGVLHRTHRETKDSPSMLPAVNNQRHVWIVHYHNDGDRHLVGVYDSEEKVARFKPKDPERPWKCDYQIMKERLQ
jgi:uncharacterized short protein YbdD (DUF466 family)